MKELSEDADWEKAAREAVAKTTKDKTKAAENAEKRAAAMEKARALAEGKFAEMEVHLGGTELKLAEAQSLNTTLTEELADLKAALEARENKWYNKGFADAENSVELVIRQA